MTQYGSAISFGHRVRRLGWDLYCISWAVNRHHPSGKQRRPSVVRRNTDLKGALAFIKRWGLNPDQSEWKELFTTNSEDTKDEGSAI